jgi:hypothetical protein
MALQDSAAAALTAEAEAAAKASLWALAAALPNIRAIVSITLELSTSNYLQWHDMFSDAAQKYMLEDQLF